MLKSRNQETTCGVAWTIIMLSGVLYAQIFKRLLLKCYIFCSQCNSCFVIIWTFAISLTYSLNQAYAETFDRRSNLILWKTLIKPFWTQRAWSETSILRFPAIDHCGLACEEHLSLPPEAQAISSSLEAWWLVPCQSTALAEGHREWQPQLPYKRDWPWSKPKQSSAP